MYADQAVKVKNLEPQGAVERERHESSRSLLTLVRRKVEPSSIKDGTSKPLESNSRSRKL